MGGLSYRFQKKFAPPQEEIAGEFSEGLVKDLSVKGWPKISL